MWLSSGWVTYVSIIHVVTLLAGCMFRRVEEHRLLDN